MFEPIEGLPPVLAEYLTALNDHDIPRALTYVRDDTIVTTVSETDTVVRARTITEVEEWLHERFGSASVAIAPVTAESLDEVTRLYFAVTKISPTGEITSFMNHADYTVVGGLITAIHVYLPRARRVREN